MRHFVLLFFILIASSFAHSQRNVEDSIIGTPWIAAHYGITKTGGDLAERHGFFNHVGLFGASTVTVPHRIEALPSLVRTVPIDSSVEQSVA